MLFCHQALCSEYIHKLVLDKGLTIKPSNLGVVPLKDASLCSAIARASESDTLRVPDNESSLYQIQQSSHCSQFFVLITISCDRYNVYDPRSSRVVITSEKGFSNSIPKCCLGSELICFYNFISENNFPISSNEELTLLAVSTSFNTVNKFVSNDCRLELVDLQLKYLVE